MIKIKTTAKALLLGSVLAVSTLTQAANTAADFYEGKTLRFTSTTGAGGTMDLYLLLIMKHMEKHLPSGTNVVLDHRPGAGGSVGANYLYAAAPKDGTVIAMPVPTLVSQTFSTPGSIRYKAEEFQPIGRVVDLPRVHVARADSGIKTLQDAIDSNDPITHATMAKGGMLTQHMLIANEGLGTKFRHIHGYTGGGPAFLALEQGEVNSTSAEPANLFANKWHLVEDGSINVLAVSGLERLEPIPDVPTVMEFMQENTPEYEVAQAVLAEAALGLSLIAPPGVPEDRIEYLRHIFMLTVQDEEFIAEAKSRSIPVNPASGEEINAVITRLASSSDYVKSWFFNISN